MRGLFSALLGKFDGVPAISSQEFVVWKACGEKEMRGAAPRTKEARLNLSGYRLRIAAAPFLAIGYCECYSAGLVMTAQAMRGGAALLASAATA